MKRYYIIGIGDLKNTVTTTCIIDSISQITNSQYLKFKLDSNSISIHFASDLEFKKIRHYVYSIMSNSCNTHFLFEETDNLSIGMEDFSDLHDFDILNDDDYKQKDKECLNIIQNFIDNELLDFCEKESELFDEDFEDDDDDELLLKKSNNYNIDVILDKISEKGLSSLSKQEQEFLNNYK